MTVNGSVYESGIVSLLDYYARKEHPEKFVVVAIPEELGGCLWNVIKMVPFDTMQDAEEFIRGSVWAPESIYVPYLFGPGVSQIHEEKVEVSDPRDVKNFLSALQGE